MTERLPKTIEEYLQQLKDALKDADPAMRQDALYDAEEYLRAELAANSGRPESEVIAAIVSGYGAPEEVAEVYRQTEETVSRALRTPAPEKRRSVFGKLFGVFADPRAYASLFYMLLALATGTFYFTWTVTGLGLSAGFMVLIIGIPFFLLFLGSIRLFSLLEGRIVETFLGVRMPRRPVYQARDRGMLARIGEMVTDVRTWSTMLYMLLMLPLGIVYFVIATVSLSTSLSLVLVPVAYMFGIGDIHWHHFSVYSFDGEHVHLDDIEWWELMLAPLLGFLMLTLSMHIYRAIGIFQGHVARSLLVKADG